ncbi:hypothetical protein MBM09_06215 [Flaviramulus sp. BrNp1-15]|uniref:hypothetical protein n=1 Tax=Flaviramulus sp. BrNp1-15 TaxID=2916754 RepID=UPI001EE941C8|nr:hypothetical protein [Flaviramulus sp. BrNp1-15]ULC60583.1 hypothetical protein MBM09_06215 [Flaviramulus sp. BrNp1-15]
MKLELSIWTHHLTHLVYSYFYYCRANKIDVNIVYNSKIKFNSALLIVNDKSILFDYSDDVKFIDLPNNFDFYFKRSLLEKDKKNNIFPLNFNVPMAYKSHLLLLKLNKDLLFHKFNKTEIGRALDIFGLFTNSGHGTLDIRNYPKNISDFGGNILYYTRLWNPDNNPDKEEKERRMLQNEFRINACRIIKREFKNASVGLYSDSFSNKLAPDLLLPPDKSDKKSYLKKLTQYNIGIADDGLKNTPGWKIGEYLLYGKAVISTPLNVCIDNFKEHVNYEILSSRSSFEEIPGKIEFLLKEKKYLEMSENNFIWSTRYLHPKNYINRILNVIRENVL